MGEREVGRRGKGVGGRKEKGRGGYSLNSDKIVAPFDVAHFEPAQAVCLGVQSTEPSEHCAVQEEAHLVCRERIGGWMVRNGALSGPVGDGRRAYRWSA